MVFSLYLIAHFRNIALVKKMCSYKCMCDFLFFFGCLFSIQSAPEKKYTHFNTCGLGLINIGYLEIKLLNGQ